MKKNKGKIFIVVAVIVLLGVILIQKMGGNTSEDAMKQLEKLAETKAYTTEIIGENGEVQEVGETNQARLVELIATMLQPMDTGEVPQDAPTLTVHIMGEDPKTDIRLTIYDQGEETDIGLLQNEDQQILVQNCGEALNYLAELGFATQR